jgi:hypothetical protein
MTELAGVGSDVVGAAEELTGSRARDHAGPRWGPLSLVPDLARDATDVIGATTDLAGLRWRRVLDRRRAPPLGSRVMNDGRRKKIIFLFSILLTYGP